MASSFSRPVSRTATPSFSRRFGVHITEAEWEKQRAAGIRALPRLKVQYSNTHERYVLCADEAGGATSAIGHYCGYLPLAGDSTFFVNPVTEVMPNTIHAEFAAASLISFEMFRIGTSYRLNIFLHWCAFSPRKEIRPAPQKRLLFSSTRGFLSKELWTAGKNTQLGSYMPAFHSRAGDSQPIPAFLHEAVGAITDAVCCIDCHKSHFLALSSVRLPKDLSATKVRKPAVVKPAAVKTPVAPAESGRSAKKLSDAERKRRNRKNNARKYKIKKEKKRLLALQQQNAATMVNGGPAPVNISPVTEPFPVLTGDDIAGMFTAAPASANNSRPTHAAKKCSAAAGHNSSSKTEVTS